MTDTSTETLNVEQACSILQIEPSELAAAVKAKVITAASRNPDRFRPVDLLKGYPRWVNRGRTAAEAAAHLGISQRVFMGHVADGNITRRPSKGYRLDEVVAEYTAHLRNATMGQATGGLSEARAAHARIRTEREMMEIARERGELVPLASRIDRPLAHCLLVCDALETLPGNLASIVGSEYHADIEQIVADLWMTLAGSQDAITRQDIPAITLRYRIASVLMLIEDGNVAIKEAFPDSATALDELLRALRAVLKIAAPEYLEGDRLADHIRGDIARDSAAAKRTFMPRPYRQIPERISGLTELYAIARNPTRLARMQALDLVEQDRQTTIELLRGLPRKCRNSHVLSQRGSVGPGAVEVIVREEIDKAIEQAFNGRAKLKALSEEVRNHEGINDDD